MISIEIIQFLLHIKSLVDYFFGWLMELSNSLYLHENDVVEGRKNYYKIVCNDRYTAMVAKYNSNVIHYSLAKVNK